MKSKIKNILTLLMLLSGISKNFAQTYYPMQEDPFQAPPLQGILGTLYNPFPYLILNANTLYHGSTNLYGTCYLVKPIEEYDFVHPLVPLSPYYTSALALCSIKAPVLKLYAPVEVASVSADPNNGLLNVYYPFAAPVSTIAYNGPFDKMATLNEVPDYFKHPINSKIAVSILEATQKFIAMTHDFYQWDGFDKAGNVCITTLVDKNFEVTRFDYEDTLIYHQSSNYIASSASRDLVAHEVSHGILQHIPTLGNPAYEGYPNNPIPLHALMEGFCDILGLASRNYYELENGSGFGAPIWAYGNLQGNISPINSSLRRFDKPKSTLSPKAYKGKYFYDVNHPDYTPQSNGMVFDFWFYLLGSGEVQEGDVDDNEQLGSYKIYPLDPNSKSNCYKFVLDVVFKTFTSGKITLSSDYPDARKQTLKTLEELGYPIGSHVYQQFVNAWYAVGVGEKWNPTNNPDCSIVSTGETWSNGIVSFNSQQTTIEADPQTPKAILLNDCTTLPNVQTKQYDLITGKNFVCIDADLNKIYSPENNTNMSKSAVNVHKFMSVTKDWYKNHLGHIGPDGNGSVTITSVLGSPNMDETSAFKSLDSTFYFTWNPADCNRDRISDQYFKAIRYFREGYMGVANNNSNPDWETINAGLSQIFALEIKKDYEQALQNSSANDIWTIGEEMSEPGFLKDFVDPRQYSQSTVYKGQFWESENSEKNASIFRKFYHLLVAGADQYSVEEFPEFAYTIFPQNKNLALKVLWNAYLAAPVNSNIEEFRAITLKVLHDMVPGDFINLKPKEYIAFYDAWAAVMGLPDYASTLKHTPDEGDAEYPWTVKVGTEVEYPKYESERLFEVSKSPTFNANEAPVHQFTSYAAPEYASSMTYGLVNLEPGQTYYIHSRLSASGDPRKGGCPASDDPEFCASLTTKTKWTTTYDFKTKLVDATSELVPANGSTAPAWDTPFEWNNIKGALSYDIEITDKTGVVPPQTVNSLQVIEEMNVYKLYKTFALSRENDYAYRIAGKQKLGSEWACHVLPNGMTVNYTAAEKEAMPDIFSPWTEEVNFKTDTPTLTLGAPPADKEAVAIIGAPLVLTSTSDKRADHYRFKVTEQPETLLDEPKFEIDLPKLAGLLDKKEYFWTVDLVKDPVLPFIPIEETGKTPAQHSFIVDMSKSPAPKNLSTGCIQAGAPVTFKWEKVPGAASFTIDIKDGQTNEDVAGGGTSQDNIKIDNVSKFPQPAQYNWTIKAGVKDANGETMFGPESANSYSVGPPPCTNLHPTAANSPYGGPHLNHQGLKLSWEADFAPDGYLFRLKAIGASNWLIDGQAATNSLLIKGLKYDTDYHWEVRPFGSVGDCNWRAAEFRTYSPGTNSQSKIEIEEVGTKGGSKDGEPNGGNQNPDPQNPQADKPCPGTFTVSMQNFGHLKVSLLSNKLGDSQVFEGGTNINTQSYMEYLSDGDMYFPGSIDTFNENDEIVLRIKVKELDCDWADLPIGETPTITFTTSGGQVMSHTFNFFDWAVDQEILVGNYHCANN